MHIFLLTVSRISQPHQMWGLGGRTIDSLVHSYFQCQAQDLEHSCCCCCSVTQSVWLFATPWTAAHQASLSVTISRSLLQFMSIESMMPTNHLVLCRRLLLLPSPLILFITCKMHRQRPRNLSWHYWHWSQEAPHHEGVLYILRFVSTPDLHPLNASSFPSPIVTTKNISRHCQTSPGEQSRSGCDLKQCWTVVTVPNYEGAESC